MWQGLRRLPKRACARKPPRAAGAGHTCMIAKARANGHDSATGSGRNVWSGMMVLLSAINRPGNQPGNRPVASGRLLYANQRLWCMPQPDPSGLARFSAPASHGPKRSNQRIKDPRTLLRP